MPRLILVFAGRTVTLLVLSCRGSNFHLSFPSASPESSNLKTCRFLDIYLSRLMTKPPKWLHAQRRLRSAWASAQSITITIVYCFILTYKWDINNFNNGIYNIDDNKRERERERESERMSKLTDIDTGMCQRCHIKESSNHLYNWAIRIKKIIKFIIIS